VIIADGGTMSSLTHGLATKQVHHSEPISVAVLQANPDQRLVGHDPTESFTHTSFSKEGWMGVFCNGKTVTVAVNDTYPTDPYTSTAIERVREAGYHAPQTEPPFKVTAEVAIADRFSVGGRVLLAGDAAMTGNPRFGLGVQFGVLWAQYIDRIFGESEHGTRPIDTGKYEAAGREITDLRRTFEIAWLSIITDFARDQWTLSDPDVMAFMLSASTGFALSVDSADNRLRISAALRFDFKNAAVEKDTPAITALRSFGEIVLSADLNIHLQLETGGDDIVFASHAVLSTEHPIRLEFEGEGWIIDQGRFEFRRERDGWTIDISDIEARRDAGEESVPRRLALGRIRINCPDALLDQFMGFAPETLTRLPSADRPVAITLDLVENSELVWGPLKVRARNRPRIRMLLTGNRKGTARFAIKLVSGNLIPSDFTGYARNSGIGSLRWMTQLSALSAGLLDPVINGWAAVAGSMIRGMYLDFEPDGSAVATMESIPPVSILLPKVDVDRLRSVMLNSSAIAEMIGRSPATVKKVRTH
jgi:hypothetical protein